jgi:TonB family protein
VASNNKQTAATTVDLSEPGNTASSDAFEIIDSNGRHIVPRTAARVQFQLGPPSATVSPNAGALGSSGAPMEITPAISPAGGKVGIVTQRSSGELPTVQIAPQYPASALENNLEGKVTLKALIMKDGSLQNVRAVGPASPLTASVVEAVKKWRYKPHYENGQPVEVETEIVVNFAIAAK